MVDLSFIPGEFGIVANVYGDTVFREGAKVALLHGDYGGGFARAFCRGLNRQGRRIDKWVTVARLRKVRAAWLPAHDRKSIELKGAREEMAAFALQFAFLDEVP